MWKQHYSERGSVYRVESEQHHLKSAKYLTFACVGAVDQRLAANPAIST
jgi:hypothetical protein